MMVGAQWLNENAYRRYPLLDDSDYRVDNGGGIHPAEFRNDVLLEARMVVYSVSSGPVYLHSFEVIDNTPQPKSVRLLFRIRPTDTAITEVIVPVEVYENIDVPYHFRLHIGNQFDLALVFGPGIAELVQLTPDIYYFTSQPRILPSLVVFQDRHRVNKITGTTQSSVFVTGDVMLEEGSNVDITIATDTVRISANVGAGAGASCEVLPNARTLADAIRSINGKLPDMAGNIDVRGYNGVEVVPSDGNVLLVRSPIATSQIKCD